MYQIKRLKDCTFTELTTAWNEAFSNYSINFEMNADQIGFMVGKRELSPKCSTIIFNHTRPIGFILTSIKTINGIKTAWNGGTGVSPQYQGQGIGKILMDELIEVYQIEGVKHATLEVLKNNAGAIALYERYGYKKTKSLSVLKLNEKNELDSINVNDNRFTIYKGLASDVTNLSFYNYQVAWQSKAENIPNGRAAIVKDENGIISGYALYTENTLMNGDQRIVLHQFEINPSIDEKRVILEQLVSAIYRPFSNCSVLIETGDFTSSTEEVIPFLKDIGFSIIAERYMMDVTFV
ncbi:GNAT family N-acetyltransferase [Bacillus sp. CGMCC 1.16607]|uniref:GNAT family N-acetyltransferase n=1 Tax=Bacillus sp. CGMCC 1.16607 TaxID=3351842 RepID=UPI00363890AD